MPVDNGWFNGFAGVGPDLIWTYGKVWLPGEEYDQARDFAWLWNGSDWVDTPGDLVSGYGGQGIEAMQVVSREEAYAIQNWDFRRWNGQEWKREPSPFQGIGGVASVGDLFVVVATKAGAYGSQIAAWNPRGGEPRVLSTHPLYVSEESAPTAADWVYGTSLDNLYLTSWTQTEIPGCGGSWPFPSPGECLKSELHRYRWSGTRWLPLENSPELKKYIKAWLITQWPLADGSLWVAGNGFVDLVRD